MRTEKCLLKPWCGSVYYRSASGSGYDGLYHIQIHQKYGHIELAVRSELSDMSSFTTCEQKQVGETSMEGDEPSLGAA